MQLQLALLHRGQGDASREAAAIALCRPPPHRYSAPGDRLELERAVCAAADAAVLESRLAAVRQVTRHGKGAALVTLDLSRQRLVQLPEAVSGLRLLQKLEVSENALTSLPDWIGGLRALQVSAGGVRAGGPLARLSCRGAASCRTAGHHPPDPAQTPHPAPSPME